MDYRKVVSHGRRERVAKISGTARELERARKQIRRPIEGDRIAMTRGVGCLFVYESSPVVFLPLSRIPRQ